MKQGKIIQLKGANPINPTNESLTIEKLKAFPGLQGLSDEEADQKIIELKLLSAILMEFLKTQENETNVEQIDTAA